MGSRGPQPTPTPLLTLRGSHEAKYRRYGEPAGPPGVPEPPGYLNAAAVAIWGEIVPLLEQMQVLTLIDGGVVGVYCHERARYEGMAKDLADGRKFPLGSAEHRRVATTSAEALTAMMRAGAKLGLSPADRVGLCTGEKVKATDGKAKFFAG